MESDSAARANPWAERRKIPHLPMKAVITYGIAILICSVYLSACLSSYSGSVWFERIAPIVSVLCIIHFIMTARRVSTLLLIGACAFLPFLITHNFILTSAILSGILIIGTGSLLIIMTSAYNRMPLYFLPFVAYGLSFCATLFNPVAAVASIILYPAAILMALRTMKEAECVPVICTVSAAVAVPFAAGIALLLYKAYGGLSFDIIRQAAEDLRAYIVTQLMSVPSVSPELSMKQGQADYFAAGLINIIPAIAVTLCNTVGFISQKLLVTHISFLGMDSFISDKMKKFEMSIQSAFVFVTALIVMFFTSSYETGIGKIIVYSADNIATILEPGLAISGIYSLFAMMTRSKHRLLWIALLFGAVLLAGSYLLILLAGFGALYMIYSMISRIIRKNNNSKGDN